MRISLTVFSKLMRILRMAVVVVRFVWLGPGERSISHHPPTDLPLSLTLRRVDTGKNSVNHSENMESLTTTYYVFSDA